MKIEGLPLAFLASWHGYVVFRYDFMINMIDCVRLVGTLALQVSRLRVKQPGSAFTLKKTFVAFVPSCEKPVPQKTSASLRLCVK